MAYTSFPASMVTHRLQPSTSPSSCQASRSLRLLLLSVLAASDALVPPQGQALIDLKSLSSSPSEQKQRQQPAVERHF